MTPISLAPPRRLLRASLAPDWRRFASMRLQPSRHRYCTKPTSQFTDIRPMLGREMRPAATKCTAIISSP